MAIGAFKPSINGFSVSGIKTMVGTDGYVIRCNLLKDGQKVGEFFDPADGGPYFFEPSSGWSEHELEKQISLFPLIQRDYGFDFSGVGWNIGILVDELINLSDRYKTFQKNDKNGMVTIFIDEWKKGLHFSAKAEKKWTNGQIREGLSASLSKKYGTDASFELKICRSEEEFCVRLEDNHE